MDAVQLPPLTPSTLYLVATKFDEGGLAAPKFDEGGLVPPSCPP